MEKAEKERLRDEIIMELLKADGELGRLLAEKLRLEIAARADSDRLDAAKEEIVSDAMRNPEMYGFALGERITKGAALSVARSSDECRRARESARAAVERIMAANADVERLRMRCENLRCVLAAL